MLGRIRVLSTGRVAREALWIGAGQVVAVAARLVGLRLLTTLVEPSVYGEVALLLGLSALCRNVLCAPLLESATRFYPDAAREDRVGQMRKLIARMLRKRTWLAVVVLALGGSVWTLELGGQGTVLAFVAAALLLGLDAWRLFEINLLNASRNQRMYSLWQVFDAWSRPLLAVALVLLLARESSSVLVGYGLAVFLGLLLFRRAIVRPPSSGPDDPTWSKATRDRILAYSTPMIPLAALGWITSLSDRYFIAGLLGSAETGLYAAAYGLASQPFMLVGGMIGLTLRPVFNEAVAHADARRERQILTLWFFGVAAMMGVGVILMALTSDYVIRIFLGKEFWSSAELLPWIAGAYALLSMQQIFESVIYAQRRTRRLVVMVIVSAATALLSYSLLIPRMGVKGAAVGTCIALGTSFICSVLLSEVVPRFWRKTSIGAPDPVPGGSDDA